MNFEGSVETLITEQFDKGTCKLRVVLCARLD